MTKAQWTNGKTFRTGEYQYHWSSGVFEITVDKLVGIYGEMRKNFLLYGCDTPEWGKWKLVKKGDKDDD